MLTLLLFIVFSSVIHQDKPLPIYEIMANIFTSFEEADPDNNSTTNNNNNDKNRESKPKTVPQPVFFYLKIFRQAKPLT